MNPKKTYKDGYGTERNIKPSFWESAKGQELKRMIKTAGNVGGLAISTFLPASKLLGLKILDKGLSTAAIADLAISGRLNELPKDIKNKEYLKAGITLGETALLGLGLTSAIKNNSAIKKVSNNLARNYNPKNNIKVNRSIVLENGKNKPDLIYTGKKGDDFYDIPKDHKYVGTMDTAKSSVPDRKQNRTIIEYYNIPKKKLKIYEEEIYDDMHDMVGSIDNKILPTAYSTFNRVVKDIPVYNWEKISNNISTLTGAGVAGSSIIGNLLLSNKEK